MGAAVVAGAMATGNDDVDCTSSILPLAFDNNDFCSLPKKSVNLSPNWVISESHCNAVGGGGGDDGGDRGRGESMVTSED